MTPLRAWVLLRGSHLQVSVPAMGVVASLSWAAPASVAQPQLLSVVPVSSPPALIASLALALCVLPTCADPVGQLWLTSPRSAFRWRAARVAGVTLVATCLLVGVSNELWRMEVTALTALVGEGLIVARWGGWQLAWLLPMAHASAALTFGANTRGELAPWAWIIATATTDAGLVASLVLFAAALSMWAPSRSFDGA